MIATHPAPRPAQAAQNALRAADRPAHPNTRPAPRSLNCSAVSSFCTGVLEWAFLFCASRRPLAFILANEATPSAPRYDFPLADLANAFSLTPGEWIEIPYGDVPHEYRGQPIIQRLNIQAANRLVDVFHSLRGQLARRFGGLPVYKGHPDDPSFAERDQDQAAYGWIHDLDARPNSLALRIEWTPAGAELVSNKHFKYFSPRWGLKKVGTENGSILTEPVWLLSCGLTNRPRWPVLPLSNEEATTTNKEDPAMIEWLRKLFSLANDASEEDIQKTVRQAHDLAEAKAQVDTELANEKTARRQSDGQVASLAGEKTALETTLANEQTAHNELKAAFAAERKARIDLLVANAISEGRITLADKDAWLNDLAADFPAKSIALANAKPIIKTGSKTDGLGGRQSQTFERRNQILTLVNEKQKAAGVDYDTAWRMVKKEKPALFQEEPKEE
ncbi:MAG: hypothetical protein JXR37_09230 [Kiritimatiellae bacterium]|nr:hypothetical protein [Kiritimatiellia bacterium]